MFAKLTVIHSPPERSLSMPCSNFLTSIHFFHSAAIAGVKLFFQSPTAPLRIKAYGGKLK